MDQLINNCLIFVNNVGRGFYDYAGAMFIQSSVLILILFIINLLLRKRVRATFQYWIWMLVFIKLILPPALSLPTGIGNLLGDYFVVNSAVSEEPENVTEQEKINSSEPVRIAGEEFLPQAQSVENYYRPSIPEISDAPETPVAIESVASNMNPLTWQGGIFLMWFVGVLVLSVLLIQRLFFVKGLIAQSEPAKNRLIETLQECREQLGIHKNIQLRLSHNASSPAVCGLFNPVILIPSNLLGGISHDKFRAVLIHELSHIKRGDLWINCVQTILQIVYFYNPFLWMANAVVRRIREQAVDEMVLVSLGAEAKSYSNALIDVAETAFSRPALSLRLVGVVESKKALSERIKHILSRPIPKSAKLGILGLIIVIAVAMVLLPMAKAGRKPADFIIRGVVTDSQTGEPIEGVKVSDGSYNEEQQGTVTDAAGNYSYKTWYEEHNIIAEADGYKSQVKVLLTKLFGSEKEKIINFQLVRKEVELSKSQFKATLPNGVTVELLGLNYIPVREKMWWKSDGSPLQQVPYDSVDVDPSRDPNQNDLTYYTIALQFHGRQPDDLGLIKWEFSGAAPYAGSSNGYKNDKIVHYENIHAGYARFPKDIETTTLKLGITAKDWKTIFSGRHLGFYENGMDSANVSFPMIGGGLFGVLPGEKGVHRSITHNITDRAFRVIAVDKTGKIHYSRRSGFGGTENLHETTVSFPELSEEQLEEFRFQVRGYDWIEFENISLRPDEEVAALFEQDEERKNRELEPWLGQGQTRRIREQILILRDCEIFKEMEKWTSAIRELVAIGKPAVPDLLEELKRTDRRATKSTIAFTLRAIGDSDAVPILIEVLGESEYTGVYGVSVGDDTLLQFMKNNQHQPSTGGPSFIIGCPVIEITAALEKITGHTEGHEHFLTKALNELGRDAEREAIEKRNQEIVQEVADRWQTWWQENKDLEAAKNYPDSTFSATLPNGVTVELLGVCEHPSEGKQWWKPDGSLLEDIPYDKIEEDPYLQNIFIGQGSDINKREFALRLNGINEKSSDIRWRIIPSQFSGLKDTLNNNELVKDTKAIVASIPIENDRVRLEIGVASGTWKTVAGGAPDFDNSFRTLDGQGSFSNIHEQDGKTVLTVFDSFKEYDYNVIAIDNNGESHLPENMSPVLSSQRLTTVTFDEMPLENIKEFQFQIRPYEWVTFKNVSLRAGVKTDVQSEVEKIAWGEMRNGLMCGLIRPAFKWNLENSPYLALVLSNESRTPFSFTLLSEMHCEIEVDGQWYGWAEPMPEQVEKFSLEDQGCIQIDLSDSWALPKESSRLQYRPGVEEFWGDRLKLSPGKHTFRVKFRPLDWLESYKKGKDDLFVISKPIEIEFLPKPEKIDELVLQQLTEETNNQNKAQIIMQADVFTIKKPQLEINSFIENELGVTHEYLSELSNTQAEKFKEWAASIPGANIVSSPRTIVFDGESSKMSITTQSKYNTGVEIEYVPTFNKAENKIHLSLNISNAIATERINESGNYEQNPVITRKKISTKIAISRGKYCLFPIAGIMPLNVANPPDTISEQTILLIKAEVLDNLNIQVQD